MSPLTMMLVAASLALMMSLSAVWMALDQPYLDLPTGATAVSVGQITLTDTDRLSEPDVLGTYPKMTDFFARQDLIAAALAQPQVSVTFETANGAPQTQEFTPRPRAISDLPFAFWFQHGVGVLALLVAGWVMALRRDDWGARMFALTGLFVAVFAIAASVYSTRQIALPGTTFKMLSQINHFGAASFGIALVGLFLMYPRPMFHPKWLLVPLGVYGIGIALDLLYVGTDVWLNLMVLTQTLLALVFAVVQWWRTRRDPLNRAGLRWFIMFSLVGVSLFISLSVLPPALGIAENGLVPQAYAFGFFNLMHIGLALGVVRWRVFELDRYSYYVWLWLAGAFLIFAVDLVLLGWLRNQPWEALAIAMVVAGFIYFPLRQLFLIRVFGIKIPQVSEQIPEVIDVALAPTRGLQDARWDRLLQETFAPAAEIEHLQQAPETARIDENGVALVVPGLPGLDGRRLRYAAGGRRLFNKADEKAATSLVRMHSVVSESHRAYERGVNVERDRISRDVHDNIGAQLLSALHAAESSRKDALLRDTLSDLRQIISDGFGSEFSLTDVMADLRGEMADRLDVHDIGLIWAADVPHPRTGQDQTHVPFLMVNTLRSILREVTSNIIKHAKASKVQVALLLSEDSVTLTIRDNGTGFEPKTVDRGEGLDNMSERVKALGGTIGFYREDGDMVADVSLPLDVYSPSELEKAAQ